MHLNRDDEESAIRLRSGGFTLPPFLFRQPPVLVTLAADNCSPFEKSLNYSAAFPQSASANSHTFSELGFGKILAPVLSA